MIAAVARRGRGEAGFGVVAALLATVVALVSVVGLVNVVLFQYGRGAVRAAVDEAARAGSRASASEATCAARAAEVFEGLVRGPLGDEVRVACTDTGTQVHATATATLRSLVDPVPDWTFTVTAIATKEGLR